MLQRPNLSLVPHESEAADLLHGSFVPLVPSRALLVSRVIVRLADESLLDREMELPDAYVSDERNPARLLTIKRLVPGTDRLISTVFIPLEQIVMAQQIELEQEELEVLLTEGT